MKAFKCPHCGGEVKYNIALEAMSCDYCDSIIKREEYQEFLDSNQLYVTNELSCPQCGAIVLSYDDTISSFCSYCGSPVSFNKRIIEDSKPDAIIPFQISKEVALENYYKKIKSSGFAQNWMSEKGKQKLVGLYVPYYVYTVDADGHIVATGEKRINHGSTTTVYKYNLDFDLDAQYDGIRFDASKSFPDSMSESIDTFNLDEAKPFETSYLAGFYADGGNVDNTEYVDIVNKLVLSHLHNGAMNYGGIKIQSTETEPNLNVSTKKVLLPVWLYTHKQGNRVSYSAINGQTGDVASDIQVDKWKYIKVSIITAAALSLLLNLIFTFKPAPFLVVTSIILFIFGIVLSKLSCDVYIREHNLDDIGKIGINEFNKNINSSNIKKPFLNFKVPGKVKFKAWWKTLVGLAISIIILLTGTIIDPIYYGVAALNIILIIWSTFELIKQQNILSSREIQIFTMKRGGDENG